AAGLRVGDKILSVNNFDFAQIEHHEAVERLKTAGLDFAITIEREAPAPSNNNNKVPPLPPVRTSVISRSSASSQEEQPPVRTRPPPLTVHVPETGSPSRHDLNRLSTGELKL